MKILRMPAYFLPEQMSSTHLQKDRLELFSESGYEIVVYTPIPTRGIDNETYNNYKHVYYEEMYDGRVKVHRFSLFREKSNIGIRAIRYIVCNIKQYFLGINAEDIDIIYASSTPPTQGILCNAVRKKLQKKRKKSIPIVYNLQDVFPDSLENAGLTNRDSLIWKVGRWLENKTYAGVDHIIVISDGFKENLIAKGVNKEKITVIPNWVDATKVYPISRKDNLIIKNYGLNQNKFIVCYSGNIGHSQNLELLIRVAKNIYEKTDQIEFVIIGDGVEKERLNELIKTSGIKNIKLLPFQPYEHIAHVFSLGDVGLIISKPGIGKSSVPSKTWSIMAASRPVVASFDLNSELAQLVKKEMCGVVADADDVEGLVGCIYELYLDKKRRDEYGINGRNYIINQLSKETCIKQYMKVFDSLFNDARVEKVHNDN